MSDSLRDQIGLLNCDELNGRGWPGFCQGEQAQLSACRSGKSRQSVMPHQEDLRISTLSGGQNSISNNPENICDLNHASNTYDFVRFENLPLAELVNPSDRTSKHKEVTLLHSIFNLCTPAIAKRRIIVAARKIRETAIDYVQPADLKIGVSSAAQLITRPSELRSYESRDYQNDLEMERAGGQLLQAALEESRDRYLDLYTFAPIGYLTLSADALISEINLTGVGMLIGQDRQKILQRRFALFVRPEDRKRYFRMIAQAKRDGERHSCDLGLRHGDGSTFHAQLDCVSEMAGGTSSGMRITITDLTERKRMEMEIEKLAFYDSLTRLPNRRLLLDRLQHATLTCVRTGLHGAILIIDLDDFKTLNDTQGHDAGDHLLREVGQRLTICVRAFDTVARLGGDEFVTMLEGLSGEPTEAASQVKAIAEKILATLNAPYLLGAEEYRSSASIGATLFGKELASVKDLLKRADLALYRAKAVGGDVLRFFEPEMQTAVTARAILDADLRRGLQEDQFVLYYQPQVNHEGQQIGSEALLRWKHPTRGLLSPAEFIPLAEEKGFILSLGQWVLKAACLQLVAWSADPRTAYLTLSINVSAYEFRHLTFATRTLEIIDQVGADPRKLMLEFTESSILGNVEEAIVKIDTLRARGLRFSLDDFGIGYSSLTYLKNLPLDQLKIDRSFIRNVLTNPKDAAIAGSIITLGKSLGLSVISEGVETVEQRDFLFAQGCREFQGFLFGESSPIENWSSSPDS